MDAPYPAKVHSSLRFPILYGFYSVAKRLCRQCPRPMTPAWNTSATPGNVIPGQATNAQSLLPL